MRTKIAHLIAFLLALLVLGSSLGVFVNKHFCQQQLKSIAFFHKAKPCHAQQAVCPMHSDQSEKDCCDDESEYVGLDLDLEVSPLPTISLTQPALLPDKVGINDDPIALWLSDQRFDRNKAPPLGREHSVFTQSFRL